MTPSTTAAEDGRTGANGPSATSLATAAVSTATARAPAAPAQGPPLWREPAMSTPAVVCTRPSVHFIAAYVQ